MAIDDGLLEPFLIIAFGISFCSAILANIFSWLLFRFVYTEAYRSLFSLQEKLLLADSLLQMRQLSVALLTNLFDAPANELEINEELSRLHLLLSRLELLESLVYSPDEVKEFHLNKQDLWRSHNKLETN